jgi:hypothetical protein
VRKISEKRSAALNGRAGTSLVPTSWRGRLVNYFFYQIGWLTSVLGAARGHPWSGAAVALVLVGAHVVLVRRRRAEMELILCAAVVGAVAESVQAALGLVSFHSGILVPSLCPPWIVVLWMQFATLLRFCLSWLSGRYRLASVLGLVGGPLAFFAGARLGAADLHPNRLLSLVSFAVVWAAAFPLLVRLAERHGALPGSYRWLDPRENDG